MRLLGLIGGMSWESTALYYRLINTGIRERLGGLHSARLILSSVEFAEVATLQAAGDWPGLTVRMEEEARRLSAAGADAILICTNTMHRMADEVAKAADRPVLHIADVTAAACRANGVRRPLLLATRFTMEQDFYRDRLRAGGVDAMVPDATGRQMVHRVIYEELCQGIFRDDSRDQYRAIIRDAQAEGADGVIFGCTEVGLLLSAADTALPVFDTTALHAAAAVDFLLAQP